MLSIQHKHHLLKREEVLVALYHIHTKKSRFDSVDWKGFHLEGSKGERRGIAVFEKECSLNLAYSKQRSFLWWWKCSVSALSIRVATNHLWLLNNLKVASASRSQILNFHLINCNVAVATMLDSTARENLLLSD